MDDLNQEDVLDRQLREAVPYIDDGGFTARVLRQLPSRPAAGRFRGAILIGAAIVACILTYIVSGGGRFLAEGVVRLAGLPVLWLLSLTFCCGILVGLGGLFAALFKIRQPS